MGHRSSPVFTVKGVREAVGKCGVQPEIHDKGYDDGKFLLLKTKDLAEAWNSSSNTIGVMVDSDVYI